MSITKGSQFSIMTKYLFYIIILLFTSTYSATISDEAFGYSIDLPSNWIRNQVNDSHHVFLDTSATYASIICIRQFPISQTEYATPDEWTRINYMAYLMAVKFSEYPFGTVLYFDSSLVRTKQGNWAPEAWSMLIPVDSTPPYSEFMVITSAAGKGYEIYALGDTIDLHSNIETYINIIDGIKLSPKETSDIKKLYFRDIAVQSADQNLPVLYYDLKGRRVSIRNKKQLPPFSIIIPTSTY
ncbi:MAG: hypothetical protein HQK83_04745 [Fibrobacteria bacterium]|nr:hypothetical protein [Fibrobacteria bacterium]